MSGGQCPHPDRGVPCQAVPMFLGSEVAVASRKVKEWQELSAKTTTKMNADLILKVDSAFTEHRPKNSPKHKHTISNKKSTVVVTNKKNQGCRKQKPPTDLHCLFSSKSVFGISEHNEVTEKAFLAD